MSIDTSKPLEVVKGDGEAASVVFVAQRPYRVTVAMWVGGAWECREFDVTSRNIHSPISGEQSWFIQNKKETASGKLWWYRDPHGGDSFSPRPCAEARNLVLMGVHSFTVEEGEDLNEHGEHEE